MEVVNWPHRTCLLDRNMQETDSKTCLDGIRVPHLTDEEGVYCNSIPGEHNDYIYGQLLGMSENEINECLIDDVLT